MPAHARWRVTGLPRLAASSYVYPLPHPCRLRLDQIINGIALAFVSFDICAGALAILTLIQAQRF